jgi:hypothetical protein
MATETIICPNCKKSIPLSKALAGQVDEQVQEQLATAMRKREKELAEEYAEKLAEERKAAAERATKKFRTEKEDLSAQVAEMEGQLEKARKQELELRKRQREMEEKQKGLELEVARKLDEGKKAIEVSVAERITEEHRLKDLEREQQLASLRHTIEDLKRKVEQGSQQTQGEAVEIELEALLRTAFPYDTLEPVAKGVRGADIVQRVHTNTGIPCGAIVWETKNAKNWSDSWVTKLKDDQRAQKAELSVLVTAALPPGITRFGHYDGVWVCDLTSAPGLALALRSQLVQVQLAKTAAAGKASKSEMLYAYLSGTEFRQRVEAIVEAFSSMREDLDRERTAMMKSWAKRERQIDRVVQNVTGLYGDVEGIIGASLPEIERLQLPEVSTEPELPTDTE